MIILWKNLILIFWIPLIIFSCNIFQPRHIYDDRLSVKDLHGLFINSFNPKEDSLLFKSGFTFITRDLSGQRIVFSGKDLSYGVSSDHGPFTISLTSGDNKKSWDFEAVIDSCNDCEDAIVLENFRLDSLIDKTDWLGHTKWDHISPYYNIHGQIYHFVQCQD
jgi:hypothetical protein